MGLLHDALRNQSGLRPEKAALFHGGEGITYAGLWKNVRAFAGYLASRFPARTRLGILLPNSPEAVLGLWAAPAAGLIAVPVDTDIHPRAMERLIEDCGVAVLLTSEKFLGRISSVFRRPEIILAGRGAPEGGGPGLARLLEDPGLAARPLPEPGEGEIACLLHTAGTTGGQKAVMLSHRNLAAATRNIVGFMGLDDALVESVPMRLSHSFGFARLRCIFEAGGTAILEDGFLRPERMLQRMRTLGADAISAVPAGFAILLERFAAEMRDIGPGLRFIEIGSAPMSRTHKTALLEACPNATVCMHYGLTEASRAAFLDLRQDRDRWDTAGRPAPGVEIAIATGPGGRMPPDGRGEIMIRGEIAAAGYWGKPELTRQVFADGWVRTADLGSIGPDGYLRLAGRTSEMINLGGLKVAPREIEETLLTVDGVLEAAVVGVPETDPVTGTAIKAFLVVRDPGRPPARRELEKACLEALEAYKVPREFAVVASLPKTSSGKIRKDLLGPGEGGGLD